MKACPAFSFPVLVLFTLALGACQSLLPGDFILSRADTFDYHQQVVDENGKKVLIIEGICGHSAYLVDRVDVIRHPDSLQIMVHLVPATQSGVNGSFEKAIAIPPDVNRITYGEDETVIWERDRHSPAQKS